MDKAKYLETRRAAKAKSDKLKDIIKTCEAIIKAEAMVLCNDYPNSLPMRETMALLRHGIAMKFRSK